MGEREREREREGPFLVSLLFCDSPSPSLELSEELNGRGHGTVEDEGLGDGELAPAVLAAVGPVAALLVAHEGAEGVAIPRQGVLVDADLPRREPCRDAPRPRHVPRVDARGQPVGRCFVFMFGVQRAKM